MKRMEKRMRRWSRPQHVDVVCIVEDAHFVKYAKLVMESFVRCHSIGKTVDRVVERMRRIE